MFNVDLEPNRREAKRVATSSNNIMYILINYFNNDNETITIVMSLIKYSIVNTVPA